MEELGHMHEVLIWGVWAQGVVQGVQGSRAGFLSRSRSFSATTCCGSPSAFLMGAWTGEGETGGWETRRPFSGVCGIVGGGCCKGLGTDGETPSCTQVHMRAYERAQRGLYGKDQGHQPPLFPTGCPPF